MKTLLDYKINISKNVINYLSKIIKDNNISTNYNFRITVTGDKGGIYDYGLGFDSKINENDLKFQIDDVCFLLDEISLLNLEGTDIDYVIEENRQGFIFDNPNQLNKCSGNCSCGSH